MMPRYRDKLYHVSITLKENRIDHENPHDDLGWSLSRFHYSPTLTHPFWQGFSLCFLKMPPECPILLDWLSQTNHHISYKQCSYDRRMKIRPSRSAHGLVANSCVSILNKFNPSDQEEGLELLRIHEVPKWIQVILKYWVSETQITQLAASFGRENDPCHVHSLPNFGDTMILVYWEASVPDFCWNRGSSPTPKAEQFYQTGWMGFVITRILTLVPKN